ncbi:hypothetical protein CGZ93_14080 [Enemella dayhoffiae]|uniref:HTH gntR-type domain-containing protein n=1 Tax=Enemella dayhoffiae TaxID=2016507 RepID=A0A255GSY7_9ACTN|nr:GntR family transcriptional regulator [Enemella dayhoffiae]OYO18562.1 hypothetical protein CGZ93_14080 [Enemella dayhoffiae]
MTSPYPAGRAGTAPWSPTRVAFDRDDGTPKYTAIARAIAMSITDGDLPDGQPLPSQKELAQTFGVTVMTIRQALRVLSDQGLITAKQGRGTFVSHPPFALATGALSSFSRQIERSGRQLRTEFLSWKQVTVSPMEQLRMHLPGPTAHELTRVRYVDDKPVVLQASLVPDEVAQLLDPADLSRTPLYAVLEDSGLQVSSANELLQATTLDEESAGLLDQQPGAPAMFSARLTFDARNRPLVDDRALIVGDAVVICVERSASAVVPMMLRADLDLAEEPVLAREGWSR